MTTIRAVSQLAGVSVATVSRAFTDPEKVARPTLEKVQEAARQLNYKPNSLARLFRSKRTNSIVVIVPDLANAFFARVLAGIENIASARRLSVLLVDSHDDEEIERNCVEMVQTRRADGVIQLGARTIERLAQGESIQDVPFVHAIEPGLHSARPGVSIDNTEAAMRIVEHVLDQGHRRIGVVAGRDGSEITARRLDGYYRAMGHRGMRVDKSIIAHGPYTLAGGFEAASVLLERSPDISALVCMSDEMAIGAMKAARANGRNMPDDLSITGFDNIELGEYVYPPLTTVTQPAHELGKRAMEMMVDVLEGRPVAHSIEYLSADLVIRESVSRLT